ncbi:hypothetical protein PFISCL1PPCAC_28268, partial [Pristionchus fissidentatus]
TTMPPKTKADAKKVESDRLQGLVLALLREEENKYCSDCDGKQPRWASWNLGVFICIRCAGIHRNLGVHISKVKSVNLDSWTAEQCQSMRVMGNAKAKAVYEADLPEHFRRPQTDQALESFIRAKYEHKRYILRDWVPPRIDINDIPPPGEENKGVTATAPPTLRAPIGVRAAQVSPRQTPTVGVSELLDMSTPSATVAPATNVPSLLDFDFSAPPAPAANSAQTAAPAANNGDMDDIFGSFVSAGPTGHSGAPPDPQPSAAAGELSQITGELSSLTMGVAAIDDKKSNSDIMALFGNVPKATPQPVPQQQPQHNWGGGLFGTAAAAATPQQQPQHNQMNMGGMQFGASFGMQQQSVQQKHTGMGDFSGLMMGGSGFGAPSPMPQMQQMPHVQPVQQPMQHSNAFDSLSLNNLFPGGVSQASFSNPQTAAAFAAASPFAAPMQPVVGNGGSLNLDSLL